MKIGELLLEKAPPAVPKIGKILFSYLQAGLSIRDGLRRGEQYDSTGMYQIRIMPEDPKDPGDLLNDTFKYLKRTSERMDLSNIKINKSSPHSSKFSSVQFDTAGHTFDIVVAAGANKGEAFENEVLLDLSNFIAGLESKKAQGVLDAIAKAEPSIKLENIADVVKRTGKTSRADTATSDEAGKIIADIIIKMKDGSEHYISLKNITGSNVAQFGIAGVFNEDLTINRDSPKWQNWIEPFGFDPEKITLGLESYLTGEAPDFAADERVDKHLKKTSSAYKMLESMWGTGYIYLREKSGGKWEAMKIDKAYLANSLLKDVTIARLLYPAPGRKATEAHLTFAGGGYKVRMRNKNDPKSVKPTIIQLEKTK